MHTLENTQAVWKYFQKFSIIFFWDVYLFTFIECDCDSVGSQNGTCVAISGHCSCKAGYEGIKCDQCKKDFYRFANNECSGIWCFNFLLIYVVLFTTTIYNL